MKLFAFMFWVLMALLIAFGITSLAHGSTKGKKSDTTCFLPEGCVTQYTENPFVYKAGALIDASVIGDNEAVNIRFQPLATYSLFSENILICGVPQVMFEGKKNPMLLTYKLQASRLVQGIGCHELIRVDNLQGRTP